ncbi:MAG TPA: PaaI family thioesterase [Candidatus Krumholzibacteria bacterium]|nr:PaaI family thioesterase [Candidatus Krumholzibacteria bacterium]
MTGHVRAFELFSRTAVNRFLGLRLVSREHDRVEVQMTARPEMGQEYGVVQGGILSALADTAAVYLLLPDAMERGHVDGVEMKMNFLRPALADGSDLSAVATPVKIGRRVAVLSVSITQGERLVAQGTFTYLVTE